MGEVFEAYDAAHDREVAVKLIRPDISRDAKARLRFRREAEAVASLDHPSIVRFHHILELEEGDAIVMEMVEGTNLARLLRPNPMAPDLVLELAQELAAGLREAHAKGIVHRDFKADNIMVAERMEGPSRAAGGRVKILDFGLAKNLLPNADITLTTQNNVRGTTRSMSPEQVRGLNVDSRSDLFSFGILLYEMLTAHSPFASESTVQTLRNICVLDPPPVSELRQGIPRRLEELITRLLEKDPSRRPQTIHEVLKVLESIPTSEISLEDLVPPPGTEDAFLDETESQTVDHDSHALDHQASRGGLMKLKWKMLGVVALTLLVLGLFTFLYVG